MQVRVSITGGPSVIIEGPKAEQIVDLIGLDDEDLALSGDLITITLSKPTAFIRAHIDDTGVRP